MAKKTLSIAEQIVDLETDLEEKNEILKEYDKIFDRYLKLTFGMDKKAIEKLIKESKKSVTSKPVEIPAESGVDEKIPERNFSSEGRIPSAF